MANLATVQIQNAYKAPRPRRPPEARRTLALGEGGSGVLVLTHMKGLYIARRGSVPPTVRLLGFDVMELPPVVTSGTSPTEQAQAVRLEPGIEYCQIGRDCDPRRLGQLARAGTGLNPTLKRLLARQPDGRFTKSLQSGTEGERLYGLVAFYWSLGEVRRLIASALRSLNDLRLPGEAASAATSLQVIIATSLAGGVGSSVALPLCGEAKEAMRRLGMDINQSTFIGVCFTPDCFPETNLRLSNSFQALDDLQTAQREGVTP